MYYSSLLTLILFYLSLLSHLNNSIRAQAPLISPLKNEFNISSNPVAYKNEELEFFGHSDKIRIHSIRDSLLRLDYATCCPSWRNLVASEEIQNEIKKKFGKNKFQLRAQDLLDELKGTFLNLTYLSIDGQPGDNERDKYYSFYDNVNYYLKLLKVSRDFIEESSLAGHDIDFLKIFRRQLNTIEFKANHDPTLSSFLNEYLSFHGNHSTSNLNGNFHFYEDFLSKTEFGHSYARNVSLISESILVFNQIYSHLTGSYFPSNFTKPSKQYQIIKSLSKELYVIRKELMDKVDIRVRLNRSDVKELFRKLTRLEQSRPYVRLLGDEFSEMPYQFGEHVKRLTKIVDLYLQNNLTRVSFYERLSELPEDFIVMGTNIAQDYEYREVPQYTRLFDPAEYYNWPNSAYKTTSPLSTDNSTNPEPAEKRQSNLSILTKFFGY